MMTRTHTHSQVSISFGWAKTLTLVKSGLLALMLIHGVPAAAQTTTTTTNFAVGQIVPDAMASGLASSKIVSTPIAYISKVRATLKLTGTWNGDLYCYLVHSSGRSVLLNRVGRRAASSLGYGDEGFDVTFDDAGNDIHTYRLQVTGNQSTPITGALTNVWAPDARTNSPYSVLETDARPATLSSFNGLDPNGEWVLFVADIEAGDVFTLDSWGLEITGYTPPSIVSAPADVTAECSSGNALFSVTSSGSAPLSFQWRHNGTPVSGATDSALTLNSVSFADAGSYDVVVTNNYGSIISATATLTVQDTTPPVLSGCPALTATYPCLSAVPAPANVTALDGCDGALTVSFSETQSHPGTSCDNLITRTWTAVDSHNNMSTCTQTITVHDNIAPSITAGSIASCFPTAAQAEAAAIAATSASDNCGSVNLTANTAGDCSATITVRGTDGCGNVAEVNYSTRIDNVPPTLSGTPAASVAVQCESQIPAVATVTASDTCDGTVAVSYAASTNGTPCNETITRTWSTADTCGNNASFTQIITVHDTTPPTIVCSPDIVVFTTNTSGAAVDFTVTATDNCQGAVTVVSSPVSGSIFSIGTNVVTSTATDACGNTNQCTFTVAVVLNHAPVAGDISMGAVENHQRSLLVEKVLGHCSDPDNDPLTVAAVSANSTNGGTVTLSPTAIIYTPAANFVGTDLFTYTVADGRGGFATASVIVQVQSENDPTLNRIGSITMTQNGVLLRFAGIPGEAYTLQRAPSATGPWMSILNFTVPDNGIAQVLDSNPPQGMAFYRTAGN